MSEEFTYDEPYEHFWSGDELDKARRRGVNPYGYKCADPRPPSALNPKVPICGVKKAKNPGICKKPAYFNEDVGHFNRCKNHGGMKHVNPKTLKHGQRSAQPKTKLSEFIKKAEKNADLINIKKNIAVQQGMIETLLHKYEEEQDTKIFKDIASLNKTQGDLLKQQKEIEEGLTINIYSDQAMLWMNSIVSIITQELVAYPELLSSIARRIEGIYLLDKRKAINA